MLVVKIHKSEGRIILAICDKDILGKKFENTTMQLDLTSAFFNGEEKTEKEIEPLLKQSYTICFVGTESVKLGLKNNRIDKKNIIQIEKIPYAQCLRL